MAGEQDASASSKPGAEAASVIKVCFQCRAVYRTRRDTCPRDGSPLTRADLEPGTMLAGKYRIVERIGQGGMGIVYRAEHVIMGKQVAIKVLNPLLSSDPKFLGMFKTEARLASSFKHANVLTIHDFGEDDGRFYLVMQLLEGKSVKALIDERGAFPPERAFAILLKICDAVAAAHRAMIVHLDLKGENIFVNEEPDGDDVKVLDFGLAQLSGSGPHGLEDEMTIGTVGYMAPEQIMGKTVDARADVYSLGVLAFEMLTGDLPFPGKRKNDILSSQLENKIRKWPKLPHLKFVPRETRSVIYSAFSSDPDKRPESVDALADAFQRALNVIRRRTTPYAQRHMARPGGERPGIFARLALAAKRLTTRETVKPPAPKGMVFVPGGDFQMGSDSGNMDERPALKAHCEPFYIDTTPVTNLAYAKFVQATDHAPATTWKTLSFPPGAANLPVTGITWQDAVDFCAWAGKRLPTEAEWERAARGRNARAYPWGNSWEPAYANWAGNPRFYGGATIQPVGSFPNDKSAVGCLDMAGNVKEWTASWYKPYGPSGFKTDDFGEKYRVVRGGSYLSSDKQYLRASHRSHMRPTETGDIGFRCALLADK